MFIQASVILSTRGENLTRYPPRPGTPPRTRYSPQGPGTPPPGPGTPPRTRYTPWDQVHPPQDQVHPPGPGTPPRPGNPPQPGTPPGPGTPPQDQAHPPGPGKPPRIRHTPKTRYTPQTRYTHPAQSMLGDTVNARAVRILLECILVCFVFEGKTSEKIQLLLGTLITKTMHRST